MKDESYESIRQARSILTVIMSSLSSAPVYVQIPSDEMMDVLQQVIDKLNHAIDVSAEDDCEFESDTDSVELVQ